jgi:hypothetical protein
LRTLGQKPTRHAYAAATGYVRRCWRSIEAAFLAALGEATVDELADLDGLRAAIQDVGFDILHESFASEHDWARYEETLAANAEQHGTPDTLAYAQRIRHGRALPEGTGTLGFALLVLRA